MNKLRVNIYKYPQISPVYCSGLQLYMLTTFQLPDHRHDHECKNAKDALLDKCTEQLHINQVAHLLHMFMYRVCA